MIVSFLPRPMVPCLLIGLAFLAGCTVTPGTEKRYGDDAISTTQTGDGFQSRVTGPGGDMQDFVFTVSGGTTTVSYMLPDGSTGTLTLDSVPADQEGVSRVADWLYRSLLAERAPTAQSYTGANGPQNNAGCDVVTLFSCDPRMLLGKSRKGGACDRHDECITQQCRRCGDSGNVVTCLGTGGKTCSEACKQCHRDVMRKFWDYTDYGDSACCARGDCNKRQQCMIDGVVITDPCECAKKFIASEDACQPCVANGQPVSVAQPCCSGLTKNIGGAGTPLCCGAPGFGTSKCNADSDCCLNIPCVGGRCCVPSGGQSGGLSCPCCSRKDNASGVCQ